MTSTGCHCARSSATKQSRSTGDPVIIVHSLAHAIAALNAAAEAGRPVILASAPDAGIYAGPGWFGGLIAAARDAVPAAQSTALLDCGDDAGAAQAAIRAGIEGVIFTGRADVAERLADIAGQRGIRLLTERPGTTLDLSSEFFATPETLRRRCAGVFRSV
jgi:acyl-CoA reductase-like NAD-dependent aldehyde dehydrogenase